MIQKRRLRGDKPLLFMFDKKSSGVMRDGKGSTLDLLGRAIPRVNSTYHTFRLLLLLKSDQQDKIKDKISGCP